MESNTRTPAAEELSLDRHFRKYPGLYNFGVPAGTFGDAKQRPGDIFRSTESVFGSRPEPGEVLSSTVSSGKLRWW